MSTDSRLRVAMAVLTVLGLGVAGYLTYTHYAGINPVCSISHGCEIVQHSSYSMLAGVPVALFGLIGYVIIALLLIAPASDTTRLGLVAVTLGGFAFSAYLTYREVFTIKAICQWCVSSAILMTVLAILALVRFLRAGPPLDRVVEDEPPRSQATPAAS